MIKYEIKNRFTGKMQFTAEIDCDENESTSVKVGLSVKWAIKNNADLSNADLRYADLRNADLRVMQTNLWTCWIQKEHIRIGCQYHTVNEWKNFDDNNIGGMHTNAHKCTGMVENMEAYYNANTRDTRRVRWQN